jgi:hypothetical protein
MSTRGSVGLPSRLGSLCAALLPLLIHLLTACADAESEQAVRDRADWLRECSGGAECAAGQCVCGLCTEACASDANACSNAPAAAACFARGSLAHAVVCEGDVPGICLPGCSAASDCGSGFVCSLGACLPEAALLESGAEGPGDAGEAAEVIGRVFTGSWFSYVLPEPPPGSEECNDAERCPTLERLLLEDTCFEVKRGCGLTYLNARLTLPLRSLHYWYESYGAPPVLAYDLDQDLVLGSRSVACDAIELTCSTCGQPSTVYLPLGTTDIACADVPGALPGNPPPPAALPGCTCEPDGVGGASVSLECFCDIYGCPSHSELTIGCDADLPSARTIEGARRDVCGQTWISTASYTGQHYAFDPVSGVLVGASAVSQGLVTAPCGTYQVSAGSLRPCEISDVCWCEATSSDPACASVSWFSGAAESTL